MKKKRDLYMKQVRLMFPMGLAECFEDQFSPPHLLNQKEYRANW